MNCPSCKGAGGDSSGPCWDCQGGMLDGPHIACPPAVRCGDRNLCPLACQEAGSREDPSHRPLPMPPSREPATTTTPEEASQG